MEFCERLSILVLKPGAPRKIVSHLPKHIDFLLENKDEVVLRPA